VSLTFDDGYRNNLTLAFPVLHRYRIPATVYVTAGLIGTKKWMWSSELAEMCLRYGLQTVGIASADSLLNCLMEAELPEAMRIEAAVEYLLRLKPTQRICLMGRLRKRFEVQPDDENKFLTWDEVRALRAGGIEIGSHTMTHPVLTDLKIDQVEQELSASRNVIAEHINEMPKSFCYPHGSFSPQIKNVTRKYYGCAVSTISGNNTPTTDLWELRRVTAYSVDDLSFQLARPW
jgi:peptidoglycan/xylan/chitin deacetylase (PgdA/CDA1 family)